MATRPGSREVDVVLRDGSTVHVCPARPSDAPAMQLLLKGLSDRSRWLRFLSAFPDLAKAARWAAEVDNDRRYGLVATVDGHGQMIGHAGLERELDRPERAEVALEIADAMQGKGLGTALLCQLAEGRQRARHPGVGRRGVAREPPDDPGVPRLWLSRQGPQPPRGGAGRTANLFGRNAPEASGAAQPGGMTGILGPTANRLCIPPKARNSSGSDAPDTSAVWLAVR
jgi:L-amino acid N-acyltransferase YncA